MNKLAVPFVALGIGLMVLLTACGAAVLTPEGGSVVKQATPDRVDGNYRLDLSVVVTEGNHSYIPINLTPEDDGGVSLILAVVDAFEKAYPELEIVDWKLRERHRDHASSPYLYGIWVYHRPKADNP